VRRVLQKLKEGKAAGVDGIPSEVWKHGGEELEEWVRGFCNKVWNGGGWPESWKEGVVVPIVKKREGERVEDYRGVTLLSTLYKVYVAVLAERLREEVEQGEYSAESNGIQKGDGDGGQNLCT